VAETSRADTARPAIDQLCDLFVYAPVGFAFGARDLIPKLAQQGRGHVATARTIGDFAVGMARKRFAPQASVVETVVSGVLQGLGLAPGEATPEPPARPASGTAAAGASPATKAAEATAAADAAPRSEAREDGAPSPLPGSASPAADYHEPGPGTVAAADELALADYDSLAASQIVPRLAGLSAAELRAIGAYEAAKRGRRTILNRVAQLEAARPASSTDA